jgi:acetyl-CoA carboxylase carboxyl transferase subunit alpha
MARLEVPIIVVITGEGGSGGALAIAVGDVVLMLSYAVYSVI